MDKLTCCVSQGYCSVYGRELWGLQWKRAHGIDCTEEEYRTIAQQLMTAPPIAIQAVNYGIAATRHFIAGLPEVNDVVYYERLEKCGMCPFKQEGWVCGQCGCPLLDKARWADQECPLPEDQKKWASVSIEKEPKRKCCGN